MARANNADQRCLKGVTELKQPRKLRSGIDRHLSAEN